MNNVTFQARQARRTSETDFGYQWGQRRDNRETRSFVWRVKPAHRSMLGNLRTLAAPAKTYVMPVYVIEHDGFGMPGLF